MVAIDLVGLLATVFLVSARYPHYVVLATCIYEFGRIFMTIFLHGQIDYIVAAGAFGTMAVNNYSANRIEIVFMFSGAIANYIVSSIAGGIAFESTAVLLNPFAKLKFPLAVINFRLCVVASIIQIWKIFI